MVEPKLLIQASIEAGKDFFRPPHSRSEAGAEPAPSPVLIPIRTIGPAQRERIAEHLLALEPHDRYLRFGYGANDEQVRRYTDGIDFDRDEIFGIFNRKLELIAMAHLAYSADPKCKACAEFGVSVARSCRGRGYGRRLFERAVMNARNDGVDLLFIHALTENTAMLKIARNAGAELQYDGSEAEAHLRLPRATLDTHMSALVEEQFAQTDYHLKTQAKQFWDFLGAVQQIRQGVRDARGKTRQ